MSAKTRTEELLKNAEDGVKEAVRALTVVVNEEPDGFEKLSAGFRQNIVEALHQLTKAREVLR